MLRSIIIIRTWCFFRKCILSSASAKRACEGRGAAAVASPNRPTSPRIIYIQMGQSGAPSIHFFPVLWLPVFLWGHLTTTPFQSEIKPRVNLVLLQLSACSIKPPLPTASPAVPTPSSHSKDLRYYSKILPPAPLSTSFFPDYLFYCNCLINTPFPQRLPLAGRSGRRTSRCSQGCWRLEGQKRRIASWSKGIAARSPLQRRFRLRGTEKQPCARSQPALLAGQQSMVALWVNLCQCAKEELWGLTMGTHKQLPLMQASRSPVIYI